MMKQKAFLNIARVLSDTWDIVPLLYGSVGLEYLMGEDLGAQDVDILIPRAFLTERRDEFCTVLRRKGYVLTDEREHTFVKDDEKISFAEMEELESFAGIRTADMQKVSTGGVSFYLLSLQQYYRVYAASVKDGYRVNVRQKKDAEKLRYIEMRLKGQETMKEGITRREREVTEREEIVRILDTAKVIHIGMIDGDRPYIVPMNYGYTLEDDTLVFYLHGAKTGRKLDVLRANPRVCFELECDMQSFDGKIACQYGMAYASIMGNGTAELIEDAEGKKAALSVLMKTQTGKDFEFVDRMVSIVSVIKITASDYTAKHRPMPQR